MRPLLGGLGSGPAAGRRLIGSEYTPCKTRILQEVQALKIGGSVTSGSAGATFATYAACLNPLKIGAALLRMARARCQPGDWRVSIP